MDTATDNVKEIEIGYRDDFHSSLVQVFAIFLGFFADDDLVVTKGHIIGAQPRSLSSRLTSMTSQFWSHWGSGVHSEPLG